MQQKSFTIVFGVRWGGFLRLLLDGRIFQRLAALNANVVILAPEPSYTMFRADPRLSEIPVRRLDCKVTPLASAFARVRAFLLPALLQTGTSRAVFEQLRATNRLQFIALTVLRGRPVRSMFYLWRLLHRLLMNQRSTDALFRELRPDLVVVPSLGRGLESYPLLRSARRFGIGSLCAVSSWDVLTTKEYALETPDKLVVWNEPNKQQACELFGYLPDDVYVSGPPHFDIYEDTTALPSRETHFRHLGLDPERDLLFVTGQPRIPTPDVAHSLKALAELVDADLLCKRCQILFRPHPMVYFDGVEGFGTESDLQFCLRLGRNVHVNRPLRPAHGLDIDIGSDDARSLATTLTHMSVLLDFFGTLSAEACIVDKPSICLGLGSSVGSRWNLPIHRRVGFAHVQSLVADRVTVLVKDATELHRTLDAYLADPTLGSEGRKLAARRIGFTRDGLAGQRMSGAIINYARGIWPPSEGLTGGTDDD